MVLPACHPLSFSTWIQPIPLDHILLHKQISVLFLIAWERERELSFFQTFLSEPD